MCSVEKHDDVAAVLDTIKRCLGSGSYDQLADACIILRDAVCNASNQVAFWEVDGIAALAGVLTQCQSGPPGVLVQACAVLAAVSFNAKDMTERSVDKAIQALRNVLSNGPAEVHQPAYAALDNIMLDNTTVVDPGNHHHHATCNVDCDVKTLVATIKRYLNDGSTELLTHACWVLRQRLRARNPRVMLSDVDGGARTLVEVVTQYKHGPTDLLKHACAALYSTTESVPGQHQASVDVLKLHAKGPADLVQMACWGLCSTGSNKEMCHEVVNVVRRYLAGPVWLLNTACYVLAYIAKDEANEASCAEAGGIKPCLTLSRTTVTKDRWGCCRAL